MYLLCGAPSTYIAHSHILSDWWKEQKGVSNLVKELRKRANGEGVSRFIGYEEVGGSIPPWSNMTKNF